MPDRIVCSFIPSYYATKSRDIVHHYCGLGFSVVIIQWLIHGLDLCVSHSAVGMTTIEDMYVIAVS
jgi:hypothetical protein